MIISCGLFIVNNKNQILVNRVWKGQDYFEIPKGKLECQDNTEFQCALRETHEEFGLYLDDYYLEINNVKELEYVDYSNSKVNKTLKPFVIYLTTDGSNFVYNNGEKRDLHWIDVNTLIHKYKSHYTQLKVFNYIKNSRYVLES